jgi:putative colanic acid biosynthesis acetyltransferase WcaF
MTKRAQIDLVSSERFPYPWKDYILRAVWRLIWLTVWRVCWHRIYFLRPFILKCFGAKVSFKSMFFGSTWIEFPWKFTCSEYSAIGPRVHIYNLGHISIGDNTVISQDAYLCAGTHKYSDPKMPLLKETIDIGASVWICAGAFIGPGVTVGEGAIVGARGVAMNDVPSWTIVAGNPARTIKKRKMTLSD